MSCPCQAAQSETKSPSGGRSISYNTGLSVNAGDHDLNGKQPVPEADSHHLRFHWSDWSPRVSKLNAPRENGSRLIEPPLEYAADMTAANQTLLRSATYDILGRPLAALATEARSQLLSEALHLTQTYRDVSVPAQPAAIFLAGHQPEMFHPGVWLKNFVLARLARQHQAVAINLQIDSDAMKTASVRVPVGSPDQARLEAIQFDRATAADIPFEQHAIVDRHSFESFGQRAAKLIRPLVPQPLVEKYWPMAIERSRHTDNLANCLTQARHQLEGQWGLQTLEIPQSHVCDLPAMRWLIAHLLAHLPRFWDIYNSALTEFRRKHKIRSAAHPVPELTAVDDWLESAPLGLVARSAPPPPPFRSAAKRRDHHLRSRRHRSDALDHSRIRCFRRRRTTRRPVRARRPHPYPRLITTLAARVLLGDLFIHGIGGAKYDELTDSIINRFFGVDPPGYMVVSGTLLLSTALPRSSNGSSIQLRHCVRELEFHPERFLTGQSSPCGKLDAQLDPAAAALIAEKQRWIETPPTIDNARQRCRAIRAVNEALQAAVAPLRDTWTKESAAAALRQRAQGILASRDYAFTLFPESALTDFLLPVLEISRSTG